MRGVEAEIDNLELGEEDGLNEQAGRRAVLLASSEALWQRHLGQLLDTDQVQSMLRVRTRAAVAERVKRHSLLALPGSGRAQSQFPAWQFTNNGQPYPQLRQVIDTFHSADVKNGWTIASWFRTPQQTLDGAEPVRWMAEGRDPERLLMAAQMSAATLAA